MSDRLVIHDLRHVTRAESPPLVGYPTGLEAWWEAEVDTLGGPVLYGCRYGSWQTCGEPPVHGATTEVAAALSAAVQQHERTVGGDPP